MKKICAKCKAEITGDYKPANKYTITTKNGKKTEIYLCRYCEGSKDTEEE